MTYEGAIHHGMNRGYEGRPIFQHDQDKLFFIKQLGIVQELTKIRLLAYCIMSNHYHLILQNGSEKMSEFFKQLNGRFGSYYRKQYGGKGAVFQDRYKSMLIQDDAYLMLCIAYVLNNPVKARLCQNFESYWWSSGQAYFTQEKKPWLDAAYVEDLFGHNQALQDYVDAQAGLDELPVIKTSMGLIIGGEEYVPQALSQANRRVDKPSLDRKREDDFYFDPVEKVMFEFEKKHQLKIESIDSHSHHGKRLRAELLVLLKEKAGLRYVDIAKIDIFGDLSINSLGMIYHRSKK